MADCQNKNSDLRPEGGKLVVFVVPPPVKGSQLFYSTVFTDDARPVRLLSFFFYWDRSDTVMPSRMDTFCCNTTPEGNCGRFLKFCESGAVRADRAVQYN